MTAMPVLDIDDVVLPTLASAHGALWTLLCDLADRHDRDWVLIGGRAVPSCPDPTSSARS